MSGARALVAYTVVLVIVALWAWSTVLAIEHPGRSVPGSLNAAMTVVVGAGAAFAFRDIQQRKNGNGK